MVSEFPWNLILGLLWDSSRPRADGIAKDVPHGLGWVRNQRFEKVTGGQGLAASVLRKALGNLEHVSAGL